MKTYNDAGEKAMAQRVEACVTQPGDEKPQKEDIGMSFCNPGTPVLRWEVETGDLCQRGNIETLPRQDGRKRPVVL